MPSGLPARVAVVCTLMFGVAIAHAERRQVAVIDLSGDQATAAFAAEFNPVLLSHPDLSPIADAAIPRELYGEFRDEDWMNIQSATSSKLGAETALGRYQFGIAEQTAKIGQQTLHQVQPTGEVIRLFAQLAFLRAQALLGLPRQAAEAGEAFALAHRFDPQFVPDAARYLPEVVEAYDLAKRAWSGKGKLAITGHGTLYIDGKVSGSAPAEVELEAGPHVVWLVGSDRVTDAAEAIVQPNKTVKVEIDDQPADLGKKVRRARAALRYAPDPTARAAAMNALATLVKVGDAVLLSSANGKIIYQTWSTNERKLGFSSLTERTKETPAKILEKLLSPKTEPPPPKDEDGPKVLVDKRRWYEKRPYQASLAVGVLAVIIGGYYLYNAMTDDGAYIGNNPTFDTRLRW